MSYVIGAWGACAGLLVAYAWRTMRRARALRRALGEEGSRWS